LACLRNVALSSPATPGVAQKKEPPIEARGFGALGLSRISSRDGTLVGGNATVPWRERHGTVATNLRATKKRLAPRTPNHLAIAADLSYGRHVLGEQSVVEFDLPIQLVAHRVGEVHVGYVAHWNIIVEDLVELLELLVSRLPR